MKGFVFLMAVAGIILGAFALDEARDAEKAAKNAQKAADAAAAAAAAVPKAPAAPPTPEPVNQWIDHSLMDDRSLSFGMRGVYVNSVFRKRLVRLAQSVGSRGVAALAAADGTSWTMTFGENKEAWDSTQVFDHLAENPVDGMLLAVPHTLDEEDEKFVVARHVVGETDWVQIEVDNPAHALEGSEALNVDGLNCNAAGVFYLLAHDGANVHHVFTSDDGGATWEETAAPLVVDGLGSLDNAQLFLHTSKVGATSTHHVLVVLRKTVLEEEVATYSLVVRRSVDAGATWATVAVNTPMMPHQVVLHEPSTIVVSGETSGEVTATSTTMIKSLDGGATWTLVGSPPAGDTADAHHKLRTMPWGRMVFHPIHKTMIGVSRNIFMCSKDLVNWRPFPIALRSISRVFFSADHIGIHPVSGRIVAVHNGEGSVFYTSQLPLSASDLNPPSLFPAASSAAVARQRIGGAGSPYLSGAAVAARAAAFNR